ncbi:hypothetical protein [Spiroplasma taiwanense]|uniref:Uncharacterized protein n=1 Tax=Spiroplasma taiwanense CT-1 TaxID=1276220 RepID=S5LU97_9MOLU|nr:hypothetical protein [Spiroplasma taiwanense]AGR41339.1 hypothetical protein STAIW_v1c07270 [Spiroplasma taiwanense CT-1]
MRKDQISEVDKIYIFMSKVLEDKSTIEDISKIFAEYLPQIEKLIGSDFVNSLYKLNIITILLRA